MDIHLEFESEIRFGPAYFRLTIAGQEISGRIFGKDFVESGDGKILAIEEWHTIDYSEGPITSVAVFDTEKRVCCNTRLAKKGFSTPISVEKDKLIFKRVYTGQGWEQEIEVDLGKIDQWHRF